MYLKIAGCSIFLFALQHIVRLIYLFGFHLHFYEHYPGPCHQVEGVDFGSADFFTLPDGMTFITSGLRWNLFSQTFLNYCQAKKVEGTVYLYDMNNKSKGITRLPIITEGTAFDVHTFQPHGISVWPDTENGEHTVFVVNHAPKETDQVEKFTFDPQHKRLVHVQTLTSSKYRSLYDIQAVDEDTFYVTNILYEHQARFFMLLELFSFMPWSGVLLCDGTGCRDVVNGLTSAGGIAMSKCGMFIYVMLCLSAEVRVFNREEDNSLTLQQSYALSTHPDTAVLDPVSGDLFIGTHPVAHKYFIHLDKPWKKKAPSQVLHVRLAGGNITAVTELFYDGGDLISGSSAAVVYNRSLLIGSTMDKLVACDVNVPI